MADLSISRLVARVFGLFGLRIEKSVERSNLIKFVEMLRPVSTEKDLIRIGGEGDGGYLIPDDLEDIAALFSPGVDQIASFELELANRGVESFLADYSVSHSPQKHENIHFEKKFLGTQNNEKYLTLTDWITSKNLPDGSDLILQMDIEGCEYETILTTSDDLLRRFRIIVIEFHYLDKVATYFGNKIIVETFLKLLTQFEIVHIHPNNCCAPIVVHGIRIHPCIEVTLYRRERLQNPTQTLKFPHEHDRPNVKNKKDYEFRPY